MPVPIGEQHVKEDQAGSYAGIGSSTFGFSRGWARLAITVVADDGRCAVRPALYIKRRLRRFFTYLILDEIHEEKGADTAQGHAAGALAAAGCRVIALTGTLIGGYAEHLRPLLFRLSPGSLIQEGLGWSNLTAFNERYGRIETRITERSRGDDENRMSRGSKSTIKSVRPAIMPALSGRHLIDKAVFLSLNEVAENLPPLVEEGMSVRMDRKLASAYRKESNNRWPRRSRK